MTRLQAADVDGVPVICEACATALTRQDEKAAVEVAKRHNERRHGGDEIAVAVVDEYDVDTSEMHQSQQSKFLHKIVGMVDPDA